MNNLNSNHQVFFGCSDFSGLFRGRAISSKDYLKKLPYGCGWVPADQSLTPFGEIGPKNPFGSTGDLRLIPDKSAEYKIFKNDSGSPLHFFISDIKTLKGDPWECCARNYLKDGIEKLYNLYGIRLKVGFEHEFTIIDHNGNAEPVFSMRAFRKETKFIDNLASYLSQANIDVENYLPEYGINQFEIPTSPKPALKAADDAVALREIIKEVARNCEKKLSLSPKISPNSVGNGVHIHLSLFNNDNKDITKDNNYKNNLSKECSSFCAGILEHINSVTAMSAPSTISYFRLLPHNWSSSYNTISMQDREAAIRLCPEFYFNRKKIGSFHAEIRIGDATSSPYLHLGSIIHAGLIGLENNAKIKHFTNKDPSIMKEKDQKKLGIKRLPKSLNEAINSLSKDKIFKKSASKLFWECYEDMRKTELKMTKKMTNNEICQAFNLVF